MDTADFYLFASVNDIALKIWNLAEKKCTLNVWKKHFSAENFEQGPDTSGGLDGLEKGIRGL